MAEKKLYQKKNDDWLVRLENYERSINLFCERVNLFWGKTVEKI